MKHTTCQTCMHSSEPFEVAGHQVVECRYAPPTVNGFPVVNTDAFCSNGATEESICGSAEPTAPDMDDYITYKKDDGAMITLHIPTTITLLYQRVELLEQQVDNLMEKR